MVSRRGKQGQESIGAIVTYKGAVITKNRAELPIYLPAEAVADYLAVSADSAGNIKLFTRSRRPDPYVAGAVYTHIFGVIFPEGQKVGRIGAETDIAHVRSIDAPLYKLARGLPIRACRRPGRDEEQIVGVDRQGVQFHQRQAVPGRGAEAAAGNGDGSGVKHGITGHVQVFSRRMAAQAVSLDGGVKHPCRGHGGPCHAVTVAPDLRVLVYKRAGGNYIQGRLRRPGGDAYGFGEKIPVKHTAYVKFVGDGRGGGVLIFADYNIPAAGGQNVAGLIAHQSVIAPGR